jgi:hypothetical protein
MGIQKGVENTFVDSVSPVRTVEPLGNFVIPEDQDMTPATVATFLREVLEEEVAAAHLELCEIIRRPSTRPTVDGEFLVWSLKTTGPWFSELAVRVLTERYTAMGYHDVYVYDGIVRLKLKRDLVC